MFLARAVVSRDTTRIDVEEASDEKYDREDDEGDTECQGIASMAMIQ